MDLASKLDASGRRALIARTLDTGMLARINFPISRNLQRFEALFSEDYIQYDWGSDDIEVIRLNWQQVVDSCLTQRLPMTNSANWLMRHRSV